MKMQPLGLTVALLFLLSGCAATGVDNMTNTLKPCPASPNCVCSEDQGAVHGIVPLQLAVDIDVAWVALVEVLQADQSFTVITHHSGDYLRAEARTALFGFVDDVEFKVRPDNTTIAMRSASRVGFSDLGKNRRRLEKIRSALVAQGMVAAP